MKILEVRDGFILIEADDSIYLSSFVRVIGTGKDYIAQINRMRSVNNVVVATAKILFVMTDGVLSNYDKTEPTRDADVEPFTLDILKNSIQISEPIILGKIFDDSGFITIDAKSFDKKMLISTNKSETSNILLRNLSKQFSNIGRKTLIIDTNNTIKAKKIAAGKDFKLPLNKMTLEFLYRVCYEDATNDSRPVIADVFRDLAEYSESVPFVPFGVLKSIVDEMVDKQHIFKLFVLKNKLNYLAKAGYFADNQNDADSLKKILEADCSIIDISAISPAFQNCYVEYIYSELSPEKTQVFFELSSTISKRTLKTVLTQSDVPTTIVVNSEYKYLNDIKAFFDNFIIEPCEANDSVFSVYSSFLTSMPEKTYLITGEGINYIPVISKLQIIDDVLPYNKAENVQRKAPEVHDRENIPASHEDESADTEPEECPEAEQTGETEDSENQETAEEAEISDESEDLTEEPADDLTDVNADNAPTKEEIIANIEQKSEEVINSVTENLEDIQEVDLFEADELRDEDDGIIQIDEDEETNEELIELNENRQEASEDEIIEPEYTEINEVENIESAEEPEMELADMPISDENPQVFDDESFTSEKPEDDLSYEEETDDENELLPSDTDGLLQEISDSDDIDETPETAYEDLNDSLENEELPELNDDFGENIQSADEIQEVPAEDINIDEYSDLIADDNSDVPISEVQEDMSSEAMPEMDIINMDSVLPDSNADNNDELEEIVELEPDDASADDIIIDLSEEGTDNINIDEDLDRQIVEDVDKVYTTIKEPEEAEEISDSDLDLIDELNSDGEEGTLEEYNGLEEGMLEQPSESIIPEKQPQPEKQNSEILEKREANTPIVPVYDADIPQEDMVVSDPIQQGDSVVHAKYGNGIVEKMIKYGTKTLYSINFENIGRRLLDPTLTEIKKL